MVASGVGALLVNDRGEWLGIVTHVDFTRKVIVADLDPMKTPVSNVMSGPLLTLDGEETMDRAFVTMRQKNVRHLAVTRNHNVIGMLSMKDFANYYNHKFASRPPSRKPDDPDEA